MYSVVEFLKSIPTGIWIAIIVAGGVIVGSMISWVGVCLQLRHNSKEREREREMALRQEVYLSAAKQIGKLLEYLAEYYMTSQPSTNEWSTSIEQVCVIGNDETVKAALELNDYFNQALCELAPERQEIDLLGQNLNTLGDIVQARSKEMSKSVEEMKQYNLQGIVDTQKWNIIQANYELADKLFGETLDQLRDDLNKQLKLISYLAGICIQRVLQADKLVTSFIIAIRKELKTPFDEEAYHRIQKISHERAKDSIATYVSSMRAKFEKYLDIEKIRYSKKNTGE